MIECSQLESLLTSEGFEILNSRAENNIAHFRVKTPRVDRPNHDFIDRVREDVKDIDYVNDLVNYNFHMGKKVDDCSYLEFNFFLRNGVAPVNTQKHSGKLIDFVNKNGIGNLNDFVSLTCPAIRDINRIVKVYKPENRKQLYSIKRQYIKFLYSTGFVTGLFNQLSEKDELVLINTSIEDINFHVRRYDYIDKMSDLMPYELPLKDELYKPNEYTKDDIKSYDFSLECSEILNGIFGLRRFLLNIFGSKFDTVTNTITNK